MKVFRKELYLKDPYMQALLDTPLVQIALKTWVTQCDGKEVKNGLIGEFIIDDDWCEDVI
ncbi:MAG: hypothetical protein ACI4OP_04040 [Candidatus Coprovivens sp.]